jgi:hypothetical protein
MMNARLSGSYIPETLLIFLIGMKPFGSIYHSCHDPLPLTFTYA